MSDKQETIADIEEALRHEEDYWLESGQEGPDGRFEKYADRIEAAHEREMDVLTAKLEEAKHCWKVWSERADELKNKCNEQYAKLKSVGDSAKLREALEAIIEICDDKRVVSTREERMVVYNIAKSALAAPARNCDVGTADKQFERWLAFCDRHDAACTDCPCDNSHTHTFAHCFAKWAQMPYEEGDDL